VEPFIFMKNEYFETREDARVYCGAHNIRQSEIQKNQNSKADKSRRWFVPAGAAKAKQAVAA